MAYQNESYTETELSENSVRPNRNNLQVDRVYSYDEALDLAGNGWYNVSLLLVLAFLVMTMTTSVFGFSIIVIGCRCEFGIDLSQQGYLMAAAFLGPIVMSYPWGYISDTKGRKICLQYGMTGSFITSVISAFSPSWIYLAVLQFLTSSLCCCGLSIPYTILEEKCVRRVKSTFMLFLSSALFLVASIYFGIGYYVLNFKFSYDLIFFHFLPWRLLVLIFALPLGVNAFLIACFYESPKFLVNAGKQDEAVEILSKIYKRNGGIGIYPVKNIELDEEENICTANKSLWTSLLAQTIPLFKTPFLLKTLQLFFLTIVTYSTENSFTMWLPFIMDAFFSGITVSSEDDSQIEGLCNMIHHSQSNDTITSIIAPCTSTLESMTALASVIYGLLYTLINIGMGVSNFADRKKLLLMICLLISSLSGFIATAVPNNIIGLMFFMGFLMTGPCMGLLFSFYVDLFPTSFRGMASSLGVLVARLSAISATSIIGPYIMNHCKSTFYGCSVLIFSGVIVSYFLPPDHNKSKKGDSNI